MKERKRGKERGEQKIGEEGNEGVWGKGEESKGEERRGKGKVKLLSFHIT